MILPGEILHPKEIQRLLVELESNRDLAAEQKIREPQNAAINRAAIFRLACCCGLRQCEIMDLQIRDIVLVGEFPHLSIRAEATKATKGKESKIGKARCVPLWWDKSTCDAIAWHLAHRESQSSNPEAPFVAKYDGQPYSTRGLRSMWDRILGDVLSPKRAEMVNLHGGRHTFISLCFFHGIPALEIRDAVGHDSLVTTNKYAHAIPTGKSYGMFSFAPPTAVSPTNMLTSFVPNLAQDHLEKALREAYRVIDEQQRLIRRLQQGTNKDEQTEESWTTQAES